LRIIIFLLISIFFHQGLQAELIRVRVAKDVQHEVLRFDKARVQVCYAQSANSCVHETLIDGAEIKSIGKNIFFNGKAIDRAFVTANKILNKEGDLLPSSISILKNRRSQLDIIGNLDLEKYLQGVLPSEMPASWPFESLKAQAVASRTYVLFQKQSNRHLHFDVESSIMDQVYKTQKASTPWSRKIAKVIKETESMVLSQGGKAIKAYFHSHCGGHTEMAANVWTGAAGFNTVKDPYCAKHTPLKWKISKSLKDLEWAYKKFSGDSEVYNLLSVQNGSKNLSGRVETLFLFFENGQIRKWEGVDFRKSIGFSKIKSTRFQVVSKNKEVEFSGSGYGHGVGLCQHGAKSMAKLGKTYNEILKHYYPNSHLARIDSKDRSSEYAVK
jgi:stage II sporulation protein D